MNAAAGWEIQTAVSPALAAALEAAPDDPDEADSIFEKLADVVERIESGQGGWERRQRLWRRRGYASAHGRRLARTHRASGCCGGHSGRLAAPDLSVVYRPPARALLPCAAVTEEEVMEALGNDPDSPIEDHLRLVLEALDLYFM